MVLIEAGADSSRCIVVTGAGSDCANGVYVPTSKNWHDAPVYENDAKCLLSREPHTNQRTGEKSFGWIIGLDKKPLYAVQSPDTMPPAAGWRKFTGVLPLPQIEGPTSRAEGVATVAEGLKSKGNALFTANNFLEAEARWTRAITLTSSLPSPSATEKRLLVALYSNRSEARLRLSKWDAALSDAQEALKHKSNHDKALLRAAVAARELGMLGEAYDFTKKCLEINSKHMEAKVLLSELEHMIEDAQAATSGVKSAQIRFHESIKQLKSDQLAKPLGPKDLNLLTGVRAFEGYGDKREQLAEKDERLPLSSLPYHHVGLPADQVKIMDRFFQEQRDKNDWEKTKSKKAKDNYAKVKQEYKARAADDVKDGRLAGLEEIFSTPLHKPSPELTEPIPKGEVAIALEEHPRPQKVSLSSQDIMELDSLFQGLPTKKATAIVPATSSSDKNKKFEAAFENMIKQEQEPFKGEDPRRSK